EYAQLKKNYSERSVEAEKQFQTLYDTITSIQEQGGKNRIWMDEFKRYENISELDRAVVVSLVERILIYDDNRVEIVYRWHDEFNWQQDILHRVRKEEAV
ncbi:MAG: DUF4368 domain-containing protein, partial [Eubacteriales bacterium]|nr:DUF4368 domain-containing protein [Eubacteriales bacterium]